MVEGPHQTRNIYLFVLLFSFHLGFPLIQSKVTKSYEIAGRGPWVFRLQRVRLGLVLNVFRVTATATLVSVGVFLRR